MQFGYVNLLEQAGHRDYAGLLDDLREQAALCDSAGWNHVWLGEHHFGPSGHDNSPNPFMIAADLGARTRRIRLGIAVVVLPSGIRCAWPRTSRCWTRCTGAGWRSGSAGPASRMKW